MPLYANTWVSETIDTLSNGNETFKLELWICAKEQGLAVYIG